MMEEIVYEGRDLEAMSFARNYHRWILEEFEPHLGSRLVEVGAGSGSFSEMLLARPCESLSLIEPSPEMFSLLAAKVTPYTTSARVRTYNAVFAQVAETVKHEQSPDSIIYINVLEHIPDDLGELRLVNDTLAPGGHIFIFVPALRWLYGSFDQLIQHQRRYTKSELAGKCAAAGFRVVKSHYFDLAGTLPWWVKYRLLRSQGMEPAAVKFYDRFIVPAVKGLERSVRPPLGKNVLLVAEKL